MYPLLGPRRASAIVLVLFAALLAAMPEAAAQELFTRSFFDIDPAIEESEWGEGMALTNDGGYLIAGRIGSSDGYLLKLSGAGDPVWARRYSAPQPDAFYAIEKAAGGGYFVAGSTRSFGHGEDDVWVVKLDEAGNTVWQRAYGDTANDSFGGIEATPDGGAIFAANTSGDGWLVKLDPAGAIEWQKRYGIPGGGSLAGGSLRAVRSTADGGYIAAGSTPYPVSGFGSATWLVRLDASGAMLWQKRTGHYAGFSSLAVTADGGYVAVGASQASLFQNTYALLVKFDASGGMATSNTFGIDWSSRFTDVQALPDGGLAVIGYGTERFTGFLTRKLYRLDAADNILWSAEPSGYAQVRRRANEGLAVAGNTLGADVTLQLLQKDGWSCGAAPAGPASLGGGTLAPNDTTATSVDTSTTPMATGAVETVLTYDTNFTCGPLGPKGLMTAGLYDPLNSMFHLRNANASGAADVIFTFGPGGNAGLKPLVGDWNGDGIDTVGLFDPATSTFFLTDQQVPQFAEMVFPYGPGGSNWVPIAGDWNGDGEDSIGLYDPDTSIFYLRNSNSPGYAHLTFVFGAGGQGLMPVAGRWRLDSPGSTVGLSTPANGSPYNLFYLTVNNGDAFGQVVAIANGSTDSLAVAGDWNGNGADTVGLFDPVLAVWRLRNSSSHTNGAPDMTFDFGPGGAGWVPLAGDWDGQ